jgi:hypothetical protein
VCFALLQTQIHKTLNFAKPKQAHIDLHSVGQLVSSRFPILSSACLLASRAPFLLFFSPGIAGSGIGVIYFFYFFWEDCFS